MFRYIRYNSSDVSCRYLSTHNFNHYFCKNFGRLDLPYNIDYSTLIRKLTLADKYQSYHRKCDVFFIKIENIDDLIHPYDKPNTELSTEELHIPYWIGYLITATLDGLENLQNFFPKSEGLVHFYKRLQDVEKEYEDTLFQVFDRISYYRTATNIIHNAHSISDSVSLTSGEIAQYLINHLGIQSQTLESDMASLLRLHWGWKNRFKSHFKAMYAKPLEFLEQDIWFLYEWLCSLCEEGGEAFYLDKWSQAPTRCDMGWTPINEIINYEEFRIEKKFKSMVPFYCKLSIPLETNDLDGIFHSLSQHASFWPWARAFYDLHENLTQGSPCSFKQPRIIDNLIVITIRTEIVIRSIYSIVASPPDDLRDLIKQIPEKTSLPKNKKNMLLSVAGESWNLTNLKTQPDDIFMKIDSCTTGENNWGNEVIFIFKQILKFVASRNYFAHNFYKDEDLDHQTSTLAGGILKACVDSLLYIDYILRLNNSDWVAPTS